MKKGDIMSVKTVGELRKALEPIPDSSPVEMWPSKDRDHQCHIIKVTFDRKFLTTVLLGDGQDTDDHYGE